MIQALGVDNVRQLELASLNAEALNPRASMVWTRVRDQEKWVALLSADNLPPLRSGQVYQLWLRRGDAPQSAGLFEVDENGSGALMFLTTEPIGTFDAVGVTAEPAGGSPSPTSDPVLVGQF